MDNWDIEDWLSEQGVYVSGITGELAHSDSYMTILNYDKFLSVWPGPFSIERWNSIADDYITAENRIPPLYLVGKEVKRQIAKLQ